MTTPRALRLLLTAAVYAVIAAAYTHPLLWSARQGIGSDRYDPVLNASILWWNATTVPFSDQWWTPPHYYPTEDVAAFTENLVGLWPVAAPVYYLSGDPLLTYNVALFLTWPLSALAVFLLATSLGVRWGPAFVGGLVFGFAPYRVAQMAHLQVLAPFWLPLALASLHRYLADRRMLWLVTFGAAWVLQALTNGYFMLFGAVLIGLWLLYFCSSRASIRLLPRIVAAWTLASLPLVPVLLEYKRVHEHFGFERPLGAVLAYSAQASAWLQTSDRLTLWGGVLPDGGEEANLFPGFTVLLMLLGSGAVRLAARRPTLRGERRGRATRIQPVLLAVAILATSVVIYTIVVGPWRVEAAGLTLRVVSINRALTVALACWGLLWASEWRPLNAPRAPLPFYSLATLAVMIFCMGPQIRSGSHVVMESAPYGWLMVLPGFDGLRVPTRFWMLGTICLATAAAIGFDKLSLSPWLRGALVVLLSAGVLADGWISGMPMAPAPASWADVERTDTDRPLIELPLGPEFDAAATYRAVGHRRRVVNGVSGYDPPHYALLRRGLDQRDPEVLLALSAFGPLDIVVDGSADEDGELAAYVESMPGVTRREGSGVRRLYSLPAAPTPRPAHGAALTVQGVRAARGVVDLGAAFDRDPQTASILPAPQRAEEWIALDLGAVSAVTGVEYGFGEDLTGAPRQLVIELSADGSSWESVWQGSGFRHALTAFMRDPRDVRLSVGFEPREARYVRLRLLVEADARWRIAEIVVRGRAPASGR